MPVEKFADLVGMLGGYKSLLVIGGRGTGRTTLVNKLESLVPNQRTVRIEDNRSNKVSPNIENYSEQDIKTAMETFDQTPVMNLPLAPNLQFESERGVLFGDTESLLVSIVPKSVAHLILEYVVTVARGGAAGKYARVQAFLPNARVLLRKPRGDRLILDTIDANYRTMRELISALLFKGRHFRRTAWLVCAYPVVLSRALRSNIDVFVFTSLHGISRFMREILPGGTHKLQEEGFCGVLGKNEVLVVSQLQRNGYRWFTTQVQH